MTAVTVTDRTALAAALRTLKLSGMLATLDARLAQARAGELGHLDFLQVLCQDEISRRETMSLARRIRGARFETEATLTWDKRLRELTRPAVLVLDDFAMRELTAPQADDLYELITERAGRSLILTSNRAPADWYPLFPNPVVAESLLDRLINTSHQVFMNGPSYRPSKRPGRVIPTGTTTGN
jgi:DNA replication protein DnaC